ncbi:hypothetical protein BC829DRAFT_389305, partial [Chytridium lagenaria]
MTKMGLQCENDIFYVYLPVPFFFFCLYSTALFLVSWLCSFRLILFLLYFFSVSHTGIFLSPSFFFWSRIRLGYWNII